MMGKTKAKTFVISFLLAVVAACLSVALVACSGGEEVTKDTRIYGVGEEGVYYYDKDADTEYIMQLQSGVYVITEGGIMGYTGTYTCSEDGSAITFTTDDGRETFYATFADDAMSLDIGTAYTFLARCDYTLTFTDGSSVIAEQPVRYGRVAEYVDGETDGRVFLGWYADAAHTVPYNFDTAVTGDGTVYAWYVDIDYSAINYTVTFVGTDGTILGTAETVNGRVYEFPEYDGILGWWVSATNDGAALTYRYDAESNPENYPVLTQNSNLYAVADATGVLGGSVYGDEVTWTANASSVTIAVDGVAVTTSAAGGSYAVDIDGLSTGSHEITLSAQGYGDETLVYVVNALDRVSKVEFYDNFIVYAAVENAQYYYVTVECANGDHETDYVYNGSSLYYDFSNCEMGPDGIKFTVYACASGFVTSVSETFVYALVLDGTDVKIDSSADTATWTAVSGATGYEVYVNGAYVATVTGCEYSLKDYGKGDITVAVKPVAPRYWSEISADATYTKATLKAPEITSVSEYKISWTPVDGAVSYELNINGYLIDAKDATTYLLTETDLANVSDEYTNVLSVTAVGTTASENSQQSDLVYVTDKTMSPALTYSDGTVYWQYALSASTYYVEYEDTRTPVEGANSFDITFTHSGDNVIKVFIVDENNERQYAELTVYTYAVIFDVREKADAVGTIYVAKGDTITLTEPENVEQYYTFGGWYTLPDVVEDPWAETYTAGGVLYADDTLFDGNSTLILYAYWIHDKSEITLTVTDGVVESANVPLGITGYTLEVPVNDEPEYMFYGWYSQADGKGTRYTDQFGNGLVGFTNETGTTLYAYWVKALKFVPTKYQGEDLMAVEAGDDINLATEVTIPATTTYNGVEYEVGVLNANAFYNCDTLVTINLPDTMRYIAVTNNGYTSGNGAFASCNNIENVNIIAYEGNYERRYYSVDGVLFSLDDLTGTAELLYYPYGRTDSSYVIPSEVYNAYEYADVSETKNVVWDVAIIGTRVFYNHNELTSITIPSSVTTIYSEAFYSCSGLTSVIFESDEGAPALTIEGNAFRSCTALTEITLPARLKSFDSTIFTSDKALANVYVSGTNGNFSSVDGILCDASGAKIVYCPVGRSGAMEIGVSGKALANVTAVGDSAFASCTGITSVTIGERVTSIEDYAFSGCTGMITLTFESGDANSQKLSIGYQAFYGCTNSGFTSVTLPSRLEALGECAFGNCSKLTTVEYDSWYGATAEELSGLESYAFCTTVSSSGTRTSYVTTIKLGANVPVINFAAIFGGSKLTTVVIDSDNHNYSMSEDGALIYDKEQTVVLYCVVTTTGTVTVASTVKEIADSAFANCTGITEVVLNSGIETIGVQAFYGCTSLERINFPEGLKAIGDEAFYNCKALTEVSLPASLEWMGAYDSNNTLTSMNAFEGCSSLTKIEIADGNTNFITKDGVLYLANDGKATELLLCPINNAASEIVIPSSVTNIVANAFKNNVGITKVSFVDGKVDGTLTIGDNAFQAANNLETIELPIGLTTIGSKMFYQCYSLKTITIPYTVASIGAQAFYYCTALEYAYFEPTPDDAEEVKLEFEGGTTTTKGAEFGYTENLIYINIPDRTTQVSGYMFYHSGVQNVVIGAGVQKLMRCMFNYATNLQSIQFGENDDSDVQLKEFDTSSTNSVFCYASGNFDLVLPEGFTTFGGYDFYACDGIRSIYIPNTVTSFSSSQMFYEAYGLEEVTFEEGFGYDEKGENLGFQFKSMMFNKCSSLKSIEIPSSITLIGNSTFADCTSLTSATFIGDANGYSALEGMDRFAFGNTAITEFTFPDTDESRTNSSGKQDNGLIAFTDGYGEIFRWCDYLSVLTLSNGIQEQLDYALGQACHLTTVNMGTCTAYKKEENIVYQVSTGEMTIIVGDLGDSLVIPWGITSIGEYSFEYLNTLKSVSIPTSVAEIGQYAFDGCTALETVTFYTQNGTDSEGNPYESAESMSFGLCAFRNCSALKEITLPENATAIGTSLSANGKQFYGCTSLEKVVLASQTVRLAGYMFDACSSLKIVTYTGDTDFDSTKDYSETGYTKLPSTVKFMGNYCFRNSGITTAYIPAGATGTSTSSSATSGFGTYVFYGCTNLTSVVFEEGADTLNTYCFSGCTSLKSIVIPDTITELPNYTFQNCSSLTSVTIPSTVTSLGTYLFQNCTSLTTMSLANLTSITSLPNYCFDGCSALSSVTLPTSVKTFGTYVFQNCTSLESFDVSNITSFGNYSFAGCTSLEEMVLSDATTTLGTYMFYGCTSLEYVELNGTYTALTNYIFNGCTSLKSIDIPDRITFLGTYAFQGCTALEEIVLPAKLNGLGSANTTYTHSASAYTFDGCTNLKKVVLNDSIVGISAYVFRNCTSLKIVTYAGDPNYTSASDDYYMEYGYFAYPSSLVRFGNYSFYNSGIATLSLPSFTATSGTSGVIIGSNAFENCTSLVSVTLGSSTTKVNDNMFTGCTSLINVTIPSTLTSLGTYMFSGCTSLEEVTFLGANTAISTGAFQGCTSLAEIYLPSSSESVASYAFDGCTSLSSVEFASTITLIGSYAFRNCTSLTEIDLPQFVETIEDYAFFGSGLTEVYIPEFVTSIGVAAFSGCSDLTGFSIAFNVNFTVLNNSTMLMDADGTLISVAGALTGEVTISGTEISKIGQDAFYGVSGVTKVTLSDMAVIGDYAFEGMELTSIEIAADVEEIGSYAFYGMETLTSVTFASGSVLESIGDYAFAGTGITSVTLPGTVTVIGGHAFDGTSLTAITLGSGIGSVGEYAFANISTLASATINCGAEMGEGTFSGDAALTTVTIATGIGIALSDSMFYDCSALSSVTLPEGVTAIGDSAFVGTAVTTISLPSTVVSIGNSAFENCNLSSITLSGSLVSVGAYAFAGTGISTVEAPASLEVIGDYAFYGCTSLTTVNLSAAVTLDIGEYAFADCTNLSTFTFGENTVLYIGDYALAGDTGIAELSIYYEGTVRVGIGAFTGWTSSQTITIDTTEYLAGHKWMEWADKSTVGEPALEMWLYDCDAVFVYTGDAENQSDGTEIAP